MSAKPRHRFTVSPRLVVLGALLFSFAWALVFPLRLAQPPSAPLTTMYVVALLLFGAALALVLRAAVSPEQPRKSRALLGSLLILVTLALWWPTFTWAQAEREPWAWVAGFAIGACVLAERRAGVAAAVVLTAAAAAGAIIFGQSPLMNVAIVLGCAAAVWLTGVLLVWLLGLVWAAEAGRDAEAELVLAQERLRVSRELHDLLGHRLGIIALKAELAADVAATEPARAADESSEIRALAAATLADARRAVIGETAADLGTQLASAELVLSSAEIETIVEVDVAKVPHTASRLLAAVVREAVTNILRHSDAQTVSITFDPARSRPTLWIVNDGTKGRRPGQAGDHQRSGTGLASLAARCAESGARLSAGQVGEDTFEVRVEIGATGTGTR